MKYFLIALLFHLPKVSLAQSWLWAERMPYQHSLSMTVDRFGNTYVTGQTDTAFVYASVPSPYHGTFVTKYNTFGDTLWSKKFWGGRPRTIVTDAMGNIFVGGDYYDSSLTWDGHTIINSFPIDRWSTFLAKFDSMGNCNWIRGDSSTSNSSGTQVVVDQNNNVYLTGAKAGVAKFGHIILPGYGSGANAFLVKYNGSGDLIWAICGNNGTGRSLAIDKFGNLYQSGIFNENSISFGSISSTIPGGINGGYIARFDTNGNAIWIRARKDFIANSQWYIAVDEQGFIYSTYYYSETHILGTDTLYVTPGNYYLALVKYNPSGDIISAKCAGRSRFIGPNEISIDKWGNIYISGSVSTLPTYDSVHFDSISLKCVPNHMPFFVKFNRCGDVEYATVLGNEILNYGEMLNIKPIDSFIYVFGSYGNSGITFSDHALNSTHRTHDCFLAKWKGRGGYPDCWPASVADIPASYDVQLYPNPTKSYITMKSEGNIHSFIIMNQMGQTVCRNTNNYTKKVELDISKWQPGLYLVRINGFITRSFMKL